LNRGLIFNSKKKKLVQILYEFIKYLLAQSLGVIANLFVFFLLLRLMPGLKMNIIIPLALAAAIGLIINFSGSYFWVFKKND
jgi:putative flippase GtrA